MVLIGIITLAAIAGNAHWQWLPWGEFIASCIIAAAGVITVGTGIAVAGGMAVASGVFRVGVFGAVVGAVVGAVDVAVGVGVGAVVGAWLIQHRDRIDNAETTLATLADSDKETCLEIREWLADEAIRQYRDQVQDLGRVFTVGEVEAMRAHWGSRAERIEQAKRDAEVEAACREVYLENYMVQGNGNPGEN